MKDAWSNALVLGLGISGLAAARTLRSEGSRVTVMDAQKSSSLEARAGELVQAGVRVLLGAEEIPPEPFDICVTSPGIAADSAWISGLRSRGVPVISELEFGARRCRCPILAVTGTNGKSTFAKFCADTMNRAGLRAEAAGNYGVPLCDTAARSDALDWLVVEASSFQLETVDRFHPRIGVLLNVQPNHLDRHKDMESYMAAKAALFRRMGSGDMALVHESVCAPIRSLAGFADASGSSGATGCTWRTFGLSNLAGYRYYRNQIVFEEAGVAKAVSVEATYFDNEILGVAAAAAVGALIHCGVSAPDIEGAMREFEPLPHRMRSVMSLKGVTFVDDSKATTLAAMAAALRMSSQPVRLIAGGRLKEHVLDGVRDELGRKARAVYLIGEAAQDMERSWRNAVPCKPCGTLKRAIEEAWMDAEAGEIILLAPGCASFDQFRNFEDRGNQFAEIVRSLHEKQ